MSRNLMEASHQWANRPDDERYGTLEHLLEHVKADQEESQELPPVPRSSLLVHASSGGDLFVEAGSHTAELTNWSYNQLCGQTQYADGSRGAPGAYLAKLPPTLAAECLNKGLEIAEGTSVGLVKASGELKSLRALTSDRYTRFWSLYLVEACLRAQDRGWCVPPALGHRPAGIYHGDRDTWVFMVDSPEASRLTIRDPHSDRVERLYKGFFLWNSEVGARSFGITTFWFNEVCGNHIVWGASEVQEVRLRHVGNGILRRIPEAFRAVLELTARDKEAEVSAFRLAMDDILGPKRPEAVKVAVKRTGIPERTVNAAWDVARDEGSDPSTAWGMLQGLTAVARRSQNGDSRVDLERSAALLLPSTRKASVLEV